MRPISNGWFTGKDNIQRKWLPGTNGCSTTQDNIKIVSEQNLMNRGKPLDLVKKLTYQQLE